MNYSWHRQKGQPDITGSLRQAWENALGRNGRLDLDKRISWGMPTLPKSQIEGEWQESLQTLQESLRNAKSELWGNETFCNWKVGLYRSDPRLPQRAFEDLWLPAVFHSLLKLKSKTESSAKRIFLTESAWDDLAFSLLSRLCGVSQNALWERFNKDRRLRTNIGLQLSISTNKDADPPVAFYDKFVEHHLSNGLTELLCEYPVLGRVIGTVLVFWTEAADEMLRRIGEDYDDLRNKFEFDSNLQLNRITWGISDPHNNGRTVHILEFQPNVNKPNESCIRIVYKPKDLRTEKTYNDFVESMNKLSNLQPLKTCKILAREGYGYTEYIPHKLCACQDMLDMFYFNAGRLAQLFFILGISDCHHENLIACEDQLVLVDAETLMDSGNPRRSTDSSIDSLSYSLADSVLRTGLLPTWSIAGSRKAVIDTSALGVSPPMSSTYKVRGWNHINTDAMMYGSVEVESILPTSLPIGFGASNTFTEYAESFIQGFRSQAKVLTENIEFLLDSNSPIYKFSGLARRILLRNTRVYLKIQQQQLQACSLRSEELQGLVLEQLARSYLLNNTKPAYWSAFAGELYQLENLDVPYFSHIIGSTSLYYKGSSLLIDGLELKNGLEESIMRLSMLSTTMTEYQCRLIRGFVYARDLGSRHHRGSTTSALSRQDTQDPILEVDASTRLSLVHEINGQVDRLALHDEGGCPYWLGIDLASDTQHFYFGKLGFNLYAGTAGVSLLKAELHEKEILRPESGKPVSSAHLESITRLVEHNDLRLLQKWWRDHPLGLAGAGGAIISLLELDDLNADPPLGWASHRQLALALLNGLTPDRLREDPYLDILGGVSGLVGPLLRLRDLNADDLAHLAGITLIKSQDQSGGWLPPLNQYKPGAMPLTGFSHGAAGISACLARLFFATGENSFLDAAVRGLDYEEMTFDSEHGNWPDFRFTSVPNEFMVSWCHGSPGIALARLCIFSLGILPERMARDVDIGLQHALLCLPGSDHLCCGLLGTVIILRLAAYVLNSTAYEANACRIEQQVIINKLRMGNGFRLFGTIDGSVSAVGFMTGLSGIGLALMNTHSTNHRLWRILSADLMDLSSPRKG